jgi:hypothetical protein
MADKSLKSKAVSIKGRDYVLVSDRIIYFNAEYENGCIETTYELRGDTYEFKAMVTPDVAIPTRCFVAHSQATIGDGAVNKTSAMENAETSAVGRALGMMGIGVIEAIASADELHKATGSVATPSYKFASPKQVEWMRNVADRYVPSGTDTDEWIEQALTVKPNQVPGWKVKDAVDKINEVGTELAKKAQEAVDGVDTIYPVPDGDINLDGVPY